MEITHDLESRVIETSIEGYSAYVKYAITEGTLDIKHTFVPVKLEGRGIASKLVQYAYDYARQEGLLPVATCSYAVIWLERHSQYKD